MPKNALVGVDIGGTKTAVLASLKAPAVLDRIEFATKPAKGPEPALRLITSGIRNLLIKHRLKPAAIGVSCGGPLDHLRGVIQAPPNLSTWVDVPIKAMLEAEFGVACRVENDANAGAVAEHRFGAGRGCRNMVFLTMGTGLGAGIIADGRLYHGTNDFAGEIGHVRLTRSGPVGYHKAGSVEGWASGGGMPQVAEKAVKAARKRRESTTLAELLRRGKPITARDVALAARKGDVVAVRILRSTGNRLGEGLAMRLGDTLLEPAREVLMREALHYSTAVCQVVPAELGERIGDVAALCVAMGFEGRRVRDRRRILESSPTL